MPHERRELLFIQDTIDRERDTLWNLLFVYVTSYIDICKMHAQNVPGDWLFKISIYLSNCVNWFNSIVKVLFSRLTTFPLLNTTNNSAACARLCIHIRMFCSHYFSSRLERYNCNVVIVIAHRMWNKLLY